MSDALPENLSASEAAKINSLKSASWLREISACERNLEKWHTQGRKIVRRYLDRREDQAEGQNKINLFTSNTQILISTLYAKFPKPLVTREFEDQDDDVARVAANIMERMLKIRPRDDFDSAMRNVVQDRLVPGLGTVWFRYEPVFEKKMTEPVILPDGTEVAPAREYEEIVNESAPCDYVFWEDIRYSPARTWDQVRWVGRRVKMTRQDTEKRFGKQIADKLTYGKQSVQDNPTQGEEPKFDEIEYTFIYEIWCKRTRTVYWVEKGFEFILDKKPDPLKLEGFWPTPRFLISTVSTSNFVSRPDFLLAQDQYEELDMVNNRITQLERAIKVVGLYDGTNADVERIFTEGVDNTIMPSQSFREFAEKGGFKGAIDWLPIEAITNALDKLRQYRQDLIAQIYEVTGISDIMRGSTKATETATAQNLKAQYGSVKLQFLQMEVATFVEEALEIKCQIIRNFFQPQTILRDSNIENTPDKPYVEQALELIKSPMFQVRVQVHADSMAVPEFNAEREGRMGFIRAIGEMMVAATPIIEKVPNAGIAMLQILQWAAASFRTGNTIESVLDNAIKEIRVSAMQPKPPTPPTLPEQAVIKRDESQAVLNLAKAEKEKAEVVVALTEPLEPPKPPAPPKAA